MSTPAPSGGTSPLRVGGFALLGIGVVAGLIGLVTYLGGGNDTDSQAAPPPTATAPGEPAPGLAPSDGAVPPPGVVPPPSIQPAPGSPEEGPPGLDGQPPERGIVPLPDFGQDARALPGVPGPPAPAPGVAPAPVPGAAAGPGAAPAPGPGAPGGAFPDSAAALGVGGGGVQAAPVPRAPVRVYNNSTIPALAAEAAADFRRAGWDVQEVGNYPYGIIPTSTVYYRPGTEEEAAAKALGEAFGLRVKERFEGIRDASPGLIVIVTRDYQGR